MIVVRRTAATTLKTTGRIANSVEYFYSLGHPHLEDGGAVELTHAVGSHRAA
jgi:hypothetical protein